MGKACETQFRYSIDLSQTLFKSQILPFLAFTQKVSLTMLNQINVAKTDDFDSQVEICELCRGSLVQMLRILEQTV